MELKHGYKQTEIGVIPDDWDVVSIGKAGQVLGGRQRSPHRVGEACKYLRVANVFDGFLDTEDVLEMPFTTAERERFLLKYGDILLNEGQSIDLVGRSATYRGIPDQCCFQNTLVRFRANRNTCVEFAQLVFQQYLRLGVFASIALQTTSIAHLGSGRFAKLKMPLPPLAEQEAIAEALSDADALMESLEQLIAKKRHLKQGAMQELLTGKKRLSGFSGKWARSTLMQVAEIHPGVNKPISEMGTGTLYVTVQDLYDATSIRTERLGRIRVSPQEVQEKSLVPGDIIFGKSSVKRDGIGYPSQFLGCAEAVVFSGFAYRARARRGIADAGFLFHALRSSNIRQWLIDNSQASALTNINQSIANAIPVLLPPLREQTAIATILSDMDAEIAALEAKQAKTRRLKQGMMHNLLTGKIRLV